MSRRRRVVAGLALVAAGARVALAQQKPARIVLLSSNPANQLPAFRDAMRFQIEVLPVLVGSAPGLEPAIESAARSGAEALMPLTSPAFRTRRETIIALAARLRLPAIYEEGEAAEAGGLLAYGTDRRQLARRMAAVIDRVLKGTKPADIPVEQPTRYEFVINLRTARELGVTIPPPLVALADRVIE